MSLAEALRAQEPRNKCGVCQWYAALSKKDRADFDGWLDRGGSQTALWRACREIGMDRARSAFLVHLREHQGRES